MVKLLSDQIDERELEIILRELKKVLAADVAGDVVEFGCYVGTTSVPMATPNTATSTPKSAYSQTTALRVRAGAGGASAAGSLTRSRYVSLS